MLEAIFYHNPKCSKSRKALEIIKNHNISTKVILYLKDKLTKSMLKEILDLSGLSVRDIIRSSEREYKENNLDNLNLTKNEILELILKMVCSGSLRLFTGTLARHAGEQAR